MHILLTDVLTCPRCGPQFGLIMLADRLEERAVREGRLGCANCRESFSIQSGVVDLRHASSEAIAPLPSSADSAEQAFRTAALLGVTAAGSSVLVIEREGEVTAAMAELLNEVHVLGLSIEPPPDERPSRGVLSRLRAGQRLPLRSRSVKGVATLGIKVEPLLQDIHRILATDGRLVVDPAPPGLPVQLAKAGFEVLLEQEGVVVAATSGPR